MNVPLDAAAPPPRRGVVKRLYDWTVHWSATPHAVTALAILAFAESSFFPIPPDVLLIAMGLALPRRSFTYAAVCSVFSVLGGMLGWVIGTFLFESVGRLILDTFHYWTQFHIVQGYYDRNAFFWIWLAALTPIPYKVFTIAAGVFNVPFWTLVAASTLGRPMRFFMVGGFFYFLGDRAKPLIERYLEVLTIALAILGVLGFLAIKWLK